MTFFLDADHLTACDIVEKEYPKFHVFGMDLKRDFE